MVPPATPYSPGASNVTASSIRWTWQDSAGDQTGFKVYADPGAGPPPDLQAITSAGAFYFDYGALSANMNYCFQAAATRSGVDSAKTSNIEKYTLAADPVYGSSGAACVSCDKGPGGSALLMPGDITFTAVNGFGIGPTRAAGYLYVCDTTRPRLRAGQQRLRGPTAIWC